MKNFILGVALSVVSFQSSALTLDQVCAELRSFSKACNSVSYCNLIDEEAQCKVDVEHWQAFVAIINGEESLSERKRQCTQAAGIGTYWEEAQRDCVPNLK